MSERRPRVELLWWGGCPSWPRALEELRAALEELGLEPDSVELREITSEAGAHEQAFVGSPTIRIDSEDVQPPSAGEPTGLTCRIFRLRDGRISPTPDPADLRDALEWAIDRHRTSERSSA
jgi:hypothetical protein